jgi:hypothetical protein
MESLIVPILIIVITTVLAAFVRVLYDPMSEKTQKKSDLDIESNKKKNQNTQAKSPGKQIAQEPAPKKVSSNKSPDTLFIPFQRTVSSTLTEQASGGEGVYDGRTSNKATDNLGNELSVIVSKYESEGYEYLRIETIHIDVSPGCLGTLMGKGKEYHPYDYLVFKKAP